MLFQLKSLQVRTTFLANRLATLQGEDFQRPACLQYILQVFGQLDQTITYNPNHHGSLCSLKIQRPATTFDPVLANVGHLHCFFWPQRHNGSLGLDVGILLETKDDIVIYSGFDADMAVMAIREFFQSTHFSIHNYDISA